MTLRKLMLKPGIVKTDTDYASAGRYIDGQWVRFVGGNPEKILGWAPLIDDPLTGVCRAIQPWHDNSGVDHCAFGTHSKLFVLTQDVLEDITPLRPRVFGNLLDALMTVNGSNVVTVVHPLHMQQVGDYVIINAQNPVGGLTIQGSYIIATVPGANTYTIVTIDEANATEIGGGAISYFYYRKTLTANPLSTVINTPLVTVVDADSGSIVGDTVIIDGATAVGGLTVDGSYVLVTADSAGYVINAGSNATSTATGGGAAVTVQSEISLDPNAGFTSGGYGSGPYGSGPYGMPTTTITPSVEQRTWSLDAYGEWLLANPRGGTIYKWDPTVGGRAIGLFGAPEHMLAFFVTSERYIVALGKDNDDLKIGWPDQIDPTQWVSTTTNTANPSRLIQGGNFIMSGGEVRNQTSLIFTDTSLFLHQWRADDYVFTTVKLADNCGVFGPNAFAVLGEVAYWVGDGQFWFWNGALDQLPSDDIREWFFEHVDRDQRAKVFMGTISQHNELIVLYPEIGQTEINRYILYNVKDRTWSVGSISRTAWAERGLFPYQIATDAAGNIWNHEIGVDGDGAAIDTYIVAAPTDIDDGNTNLDIFGFLPDVNEQVGNLSLFVLTRNNAADTPVSDGPYTIATAGEAIDLRSSGKMAGFRIESNVIGGNFKLGMCRVEAQPAGARR